MYLMTPVDDRVDDFDEFVELQEKNNIKLLSSKVHGYEMDGKDRANVSLSYKIEVENGDTTEIIEKDVVWESVREGNIWKIRAEF